MLLPTRWLAVLLCPKENEGMSELNKITDRDNTDELVSLKHREMGYTPLRHEGHALLNGMFGPCDQDPRLHNIANQRRRWIWGHSGGIPRNMPLSDDPEKCSSIHYDQ